MKNTLVAAALLLATLGSAHLASAQHSSAPHAAVAASGVVQPTSASPDDLGWGGGTPAATAS
jgi:hypothetical protein